MNLSVNTESPISFASLNILKSDPANSVLNDLNLKIDQLESELKTLYQDIQKYHIKSAADLMAHDIATLALINSNVNALRTDLYGKDSQGNFGTPDNPLPNSAAWFAGTDDKGNPRSINAFNLFTNQVDFSNLTGVLSAEIPNDGSMFSNADSVGDIASYLFSLTDNGTQPFSILTQFQNYTGQ
ncbi:MAG: hypothetical protein JSS32_09565 [Verrucomicrobia bacterium]|nr:hypothetical protein [Verrucomicrobiota bacterium]